MINKIQNKDFVPFKRHPPIFLLVLIFVFGSQSWNAQAAGVANDDFDILDFLIPIISDPCIRNSGPWSRTCLWERHAFYCPETTINGITVPEYPSKPHPNPSEVCDDGDMTLFNGLLCASGDERGCDGVKRAQSSDGQFWRSPRRAAARKDDFSPDMSLGVLLYLAKTRDTQVLERWLDWIENDRRGRSSIALPHFCGSNSCIMRPIDVDQMAEAAYALGVTPPDGIKNYYDIAELGGIFDTCGKIQFDIDNTAKPGYERHLNGVRILLMRMLNTGDAGKLNDLARKLAESEPENPCFAYLNEGATASVRELTMRLCPATTGDVQESNRRQWAWERTDSEEAWKNSMLWDCIFMTNIFKRIDPIEHRTPYFEDNFICENPVSKSKGKMACWFEVKQEQPSTTSVSINIYNTPVERAIEYWDVAEVGKRVMWEINTGTLAAGSCYTARASFNYSCLGDSKEVKFCVNR